MSEPYDWLQTPLQSGITLIEASAGTGKTYTIAGLVLRLLLEGRAEDISRILVVTFTIAATQELHDRIRARIREAIEVFTSGQGDDSLLVLRTRHGEPGLQVLKAALTRFDEVAICTIHGFCMRTLEQSAFESGQPFEFEFITDDSDLKMRAAHDFWRRTIYSADKLVSALVVHNDWTPTTFLSDYENWSRFPATQILPAAKSMEELNNTFSEMVARMRTAWQEPGLAAALNGVRFNKDKAPFGKNGPELLLERIRAVVFEEEFDGFEHLLLLDPTRLAAGTSRTKANLAARENLLAHPFVRACDGLSQLAEMVEHSLRVAFIRQVGINMDRAKRDDNQLSFDDLLYRLHQALTSPRGRQLIGEAVAKRYQVALIDEFQDTDLLQYDIFKRIFPGGPLYLIGDPKQSIYSFRGADIFAYLAARQDAAHSYTLTRNWRSHQQLVAAVNGVFEAADQPFVHRDIPFHPVAGAGNVDDDAPRDIPGPVFQWWYLQPELNDKGKEVFWSKDRAGEVICTAVANEIVALLERRPLLEGRPLHPGDCAVLVRTNKQAVLVQNSLRRAGLPAVIAQSGDIFASEEMAELALVLKAVLDPLDTRVLHAGLATLIWGLEAAAIHRLTEEEEQLLHIVERCRSYLQLWAERGLMPMMRAFTVDFAVRRRLLAYGDGERRLTNLLHAVELLHGVAVSRQSGPKSLVRWLDGQRARDRHEPEISELRLESDERAVRIVTIHKSKGLEYNIVFCPFLWDGFAPNAKRPVVVHADKDRIVYDCGSAEKGTHDAMARDEALAEDTRLAYVAMTRAKYRCYVVWGAIGNRGSGARCSALGYLLHQGEATAGMSPGEIMQRLGESGADWHGDLARLVARYRACMGLHLLAVDALSARWRSGTHEAAQLSVRSFRRDRELQASWYTSSFSSLIRGLDAERPDYGDPSADRDEEDEGTPTGIFAFARGTNAGKCLHDILEHLEFDKLDEGAAELVETHLRRYDFFDPARHPHSLDPSAAVLNMLRLVCGTTIPRLGFSLGEIGAECCFTEWNFYMSIQTLRPRQLADVFRRFGPEQLRAVYPSRLDQLDPRRLAGFLTGFVDLCFCHRGRWYVVDWKSNYLGSRAQDYGPEAMSQAMIEHDYLLQYHLYITALHRYLASRQSDYDYDHHMGGVIYVFLRGVDGHEENGWFIDRPARELVTALDGFFGVRP